MSLARVKNWIAETLTFSDLNAEFNNILNNPSSLITPITFHLTFTDATYDIGASGAARPRDLFLSRNATIGGTLGVTGITTLSAAIVGATSQDVFNTVSTTINAFAGASVALNIGNASAAAAFPGGISIPTGKTLSGAGAINISGAITGAAGSFSTGAFSGNVTITKNTPMLGLTAATGTTDVWRLQVIESDQRFEILNNTSGSGSVFQISRVGVVTVSQLASGSLTSASGVLTSSSDERLKDITGELEYGIAEVMQLHPIRYHWNKVSGIPMEPEYGGFGAGDVEKAMPLAVAYGKDGMRALNDRVILGALVNAMKKCSERITTLEAQ